MTGVIASGNRWCVRTSFRLVHVGSSPCYGDDVDRHAEERKRGAGGGEAPHTNNPRTFQPAGGGTGGGDGSFEGKLAPAAAAPAGQPRAAPPAWRRADRSALQEHFQQAPRRPTSALKGWVRLLRAEPTLRSRPRITQACALDTLMGNVPSWVAGNLGAEVPCCFCKGDRGLFLWCADCETWDANGSVAGVTPDNAGGGVGQTRPAATPDNAGGGVGQCRRRPQTMPVAAWGIPQLTRVREAATQT